MNNTLLAQRYINALTRTLEKQDIEQQLLSFRDFVKDVIEHEMLWELVTGPFLSRVQKLDTLEDMMKRYKFNKKLCAFIALLIQKQRLTLLPFFKTELDNAISEVQKKIHVDVVIGDDLTQSQRKSLTVDLSKKLGRDVVINIKKNNNILGGFKVYANNNIYDATVDNAFQKLRWSFN